LIQLKIDHLRFPWYWHSPNWRIASPVLMEVSRLP
jgi:hypothetical protein